MRSGWRRLAKTVALTATLTTAFWFAVAAWWYQHRAAGSASAPPAPAARATMPARPAPEPEERPENEAELLIPVVGMKAEQLSDTFTQARASGARHHDAIDIMAPRGTPVIAAAAGRVEKLFLSNDGGNTVYLRSPDGGRLYYYAHLDGYAAGVAEGRWLERGAPIGTVGATGNADPAAPHLHFAVWATAPGRAWWEKAVALNPYPLLQPR